MPLSLVVGSALAFWLRRGTVHATWGCRRLWLITTNDNEPAMTFYSRWGMHLVTVHRGAIAESRKLKPEISHFGVGGRPIEDEIEFELLLE
jgi:hypothetical protein